MRTAIGVLSSMLMLECGVPDARAASEEEPAVLRMTIARMIAPPAGGWAPEPPLFQRVDCNMQRLQDCRRFCVGEYRAAAAASKRCLRACNQYCTTCSADRRRYCRAT